MTNGHENEIADLIEDRVRNTMTIMRLELNQTMYGDSRPADRLSRRRRMKIWLWIRWNRMVDAWLVLTGRADIG
jgi:hypothetical protein